MSASLLVVLSVFLISQENASPGSRMSGTVLDSMNRRIAGVTLSLVSVEDKKKRQTKTDKQGRFEFKELPNGKYALDVRQMGFRNDQTVVEITGADLQRTVTMRLGGLEETIKVSGRTARGGSQKFPQPDSVKRAGEPCVDSGEGGAIRPPFKLLHVAPGYPPLMLDSRVEGTVVLTGQLGSDGAPQNLTATGEPNAGLTAAAMDAARQFRFSPLLLNCVPAPIDMTLTFVFSVR